MYEHTTMKRYVRDGEKITATAGKRTDTSYGCVDYWAEAEWYGYDDQYFDTFDEAVAWLEGEGFTEVTA